MVLHAISAYGGICAILNKMITVEDIVEAVEKLPPDKLAKFRVWFEEFEAKRFDRKIEQDARSKKLNHLAEQALRQHRNYRATPGELLGIERGLRDAANGKLASDEQVKAVFAKHRPAKDAL